MNLKTRRTLFYFFILIFVLAGAYLLATAQGLVLDFKNLKITGTGGLFLKYVPPDATVELNGKKTDVSPGLVSSGIFISKLIPDEYRVKISKPGFSAWEKTLAVKNGAVASASQIRLWPEVWDLNVITTSSVRDFRLTGAGLVLQGKNGTLRLDGFSLGNRSVALSGPDSSLIVTTDEKENFVTNLEDLSPALDIVRLFNSLKQSQLNLPGTIIPKNYFLHPFNAKILITTGNALYSLDIKRLRLEKLTDMAGIKKAELRGNEMFLFDMKDNITTFNLFLQTARIYESTSTEAIGIGASLAGLPAPDGKKIFLLSKNDTLSLKVLENYYADGEVRKGDMWPVFSDRGKITDFKWLNGNSNYALVLAEKNLFIVETDRRTPQNIRLISQGVEKFATEGNDLYILKTDGTLLRASLK
ncbi:MAG: hypothetical protein AAB377_00285 [Patescibacteria group bacterium]